MYSEHDNVEIHAGKGEGDMSCPNCDAFLEIQPTPYGRKAVCERDNIRWTQLHSEWKDNVWMDEIARGPM